MLSGCAVEMLKSGRVLLLSAMPEVSMVEFLFVFMSMMGMLVGPVNALVTKEAQLPLVYTMSVGVGVMAEAGGPVSDVVTLFPV